VRESGLRSGTATVFCPGSTHAVTTIEFEPGALADLRRLLDEIVPPDRDYAHDRRWGDGNGHSHVRAALLGPSVSVPFADGELMLGTWQQLVHCDFDNRERSRRIVVQIVGE
jgi:secondary thiamine-phosphate synthase enzyme